MTSFQPPAITSYTCVENGLSFQVNVYQLPSGKFEASITVLEGHADFNAIYFGDAVDDGSSFAFGGKDQNLNMNGRDLDHDGNVVDWDGGMKLSSPGLGKAGLSKVTYLTSGETMTVSLPGITSLDQLEDIGIRATSTSTPEGSIKCVLSPDDDTEKDGDPVVTADGSDANPMLATVNDAGAPTGSPDNTPPADQGDGASRPLDDGPAGAVESVDAAPVPAPADAPAEGPAEGPAAPADDNSDSSEDDPNLYMILATLPNLDHEFPAEEDEPQPEEFLLF